MHYDREGIGNQDDAPAVGDGSLIAITKTNRATLLTIAAAAILASAVVTAGSLDTAPAVATAAAPTYSEGNHVTLSTDLAGNLRTSGGGGGGGNPTGGWLDSVRLVTSDSVRKVLGGWLDSLRGGRLDSVRVIARIDSMRLLEGGRLDSTALTRRAALDTVRYLLAGRLDSTAFTRRAAIDTLRFGRVADSIFFPLGGNRVKTVDSLASWFGSTAPTVGQKTMANSLPVAIASDQTAVAVSGTVTANQGGAPWVVVDTLRDRSTMTTGGTVGAVQLGSTTGKTNVLKTGSLTTTATTADQVVLTYTVTGGKVFYVEYLTCEARLTTLSATASILGTISLETPSGTKDITYSLVNGTTELDDKCPTTTFAEPIPVAAGVVIRCVTTPAAATSMLWICNFGGYER